MACRVPGRLSFDVLGAGLYLGEHRREETVNRFEPVHVGEFAPSLADLARVAVGSRLDEGPAQLGDVLDALSGPSLFPIDQPYGESTSDDDVSRLQIVVDHTLEAVDHPSREIVQLPHHPGERDQIDLMTRCRGSPWDPGDDLAAQFIDPQRARSPHSASVSEKAQDALDERGVLGASPSDRIADAKRMIHQARVAQPAIIRGGGIRGRVVGDTPGSRWRCGAKYPEGVWPQLRQHACKCCPIEHGVWVPPTLWPSLGIISYRLRGSKRETSWVRTYDTQLTAVTAPPAPWSPRSALA